VPRRKIGIPAIAVQRNSPVKRINLVRLVFFFEGTVRDDTYRPKMGLKMKDVRE
jgi:hypothetical protein